MRAATNIKNNKKWLSDLIEENDYKDWNGKKVLVSAGTGTGKSTVALEYCGYLQNENKTVAYLTNRTALDRQIEAAVKDRNLNNVKVTTYQSLEKQITKGYKLDFDVYIADEGHWFQSDSLFNSYSDIPYNFLIHQTGTVVFMSATGENIFRQIKEDVDSKDIIETPSVPTDYSHVRKVYWWEKKDDLYGIVDRILNETNDKIIYFCNSGSKMKHFYEHYDPSGGSSNKGSISESRLNDIEFYCSGRTNDKWLKEHCNPKALKSSSKGYTFSKRVLVTTKVIDNGVDLKDSKIRHIILDVFDIESALQCLGRKRPVNEKDCCNFYIRDWLSYELNGFRRCVRKELEASVLIMKDKELWKKNYLSNRGYQLPETIYYDPETDDYKVNHLRYAKLQNDSALIEKMVQKEITYRNILIEKMGKDIKSKCEDITNVKADRIKKDLEIFLEDNCGIKLLKDKQTELVNLCNLRDRWNRVQKKISTIQGYIEDNYPFTLKSKQTKRNGKYVTYWIIKQKL